MKTAVLYFRIPVEQVATPPELLGGQRAELIKYCSQNQLSVIREFADLDIESDPRRSQQLHETMNLFIDRAIAKNPIDYLVIVSDSVIPIDISYLRSEIGCCCSELIIIDKL